jgi:hypothetical protein
MWRKIPDHGPCRADRSIGLGQKSGGCTPKRRCHPRDARTKLVMLFGSLQPAMADDHLFDLPAQDPSLASAENWLRSGGSSARIDSYVLMYILVDTSEAIYE